MCKERKGRALPLSPHASALRSPALTQHVGGLNHVGVQVSPVQSLIGIINREVIGPAHLVYQRHAIGPIHEGPHDPWLAAPLSPVDVAGKYQERGDGQDSGEFWLNRGFGAESSHHLLDSAPGSKKEPDPAELQPQLWLSPESRKDPNAAKQDK